MWVWNQSYLGLGKGDGVSGDTRGDLVLGTVWAFVLGTDREFFCSVASEKLSRIQQEKLSIDGSILGLFHHVT